MHVQNSAEDGVAHVSEITDFGVGVHVEEHGGFDGQFSVDVTLIGVVVELGGVGGLESGGEIAVGEQFRLDQHLQIGVVGSTVPEVGDMASVHDFSEDVLKIVIRHLFVGGQVIVQDIGADAQVTVVEVIASGPALSAEFLSTQDEGVEIAQTEENSLELGLFGTGVDGLLTEEGETASNVGLQILGSLVGDLDGTLEDRLGDDVHPGEGWGFRGNETSEVLVAGLGDFFQITFQPVLPDQPGLHQMHVLEHHPGTIRGSVEQSLLSSGLLTLSHGNVHEFSVGDGDIEFMSDVLDLGGWVHTGEQHEEDRGVGSGLIIRFHHVERSLLDVRSAHLIFDEKTQS